LVVEVPAFLLFANRSALAPEDERALLFQESACVGCGLKGELEIGGVNDVLHAHMLCPFFYRI